MGRKSAMGIAGDGNSGNRLVGMLGVRIEKRGPLGTETARISAILLVGTLKDRAVFKADSRTHFELGIGAVRMEDILLCSLNEGTIFFRKFVFLIRLDARLDGKFVHLFYLFFMRPFERKAPIEVKFKIENAKIVFFFGIS